MSFPDYAGLTAKVDNVDTIMAADINELQDAIQEIAVRGYGTFPMAEGAWYGPGTAVGGTFGSDENEMVIGGDLALASLIYIYEACTISKVSVFPTYAPSSDATLLFSIHETNSDAQVGLKVGDLGSAVSPASFTGDRIEDTCSVAVTPGWYFLVAASDVDVQIEYLTTTAGGHFSGPFPEQGQIGWRITSTGIGSAIPSNLTSASFNDRQTVPNIMFQVDHP